MFWSNGHPLQNGKFRIETVLGQGGFGITYKAIHQGFQAPMVIKTPNAFLQNDPDYPKYVQRFIREARILANLPPHPHIVRVNDIFEEDTAHCLVMEFIEGMSLYELVQQRGAIPEKEALGYIRPIAEALAMVHDAGLVHRDATPLNIMLRDNSYPVLIDFGISGEIIPTTISSKMFGNRAFAPYEQMIKGNREPVVDVYTLAATLYYVVTGQLPVDSLSRRVDDEELIPPQDLVTVSDRVNEAIMQGMALKPSQRPPTMPDWLQLLVVEEVEPTPPRYQRLEALLAAGKWQEADKETTKVMLQVAGREKEGYLDVQSIDNFPCEDLRAIDRLWVKYSQGRFGFSVQKRIYQSLGGTRKYNSEVWEKFGDRVGWREGDRWLYYNDLTFNLTAKEGHLPVLRIRWDRIWRGLMPFLLSRGDL